MPASDQPRLLAIDSSSFSGSVALCQGETLVAEILLNSKGTHSDTLLQQIDTLLVFAGWRKEDLDLLAVVNGPGSFTGLRIGLATVKGLAQVLQRPVVPVTSLQAVAMNLPLSPVPICAFLDARKKEVYSQLFEWRDNGPVAISAAQVAPPQKVLSELQGQVALVGDGVPLYREEIERTLAGRVLLPAAPAHRLKASQAAWLALKAWGKKDFLPPAELLPCYIRPSDAELNPPAKQSVRARVSC